MSLAENVLRLRRKAGMTQDALTAISGVTSVKQIETGAITSPRYGTLDALARALGVTVADLYRERAARMTNNRQRRKSA